MAIDWMPIEIETPDKPEILQVAEHLQVEPDAAFGKCFRVWGWFDRQTVDGVANGITPGMLDNAVRSPGIAAAMESAGWLQVYDDKIVMPNFRTHCGESAKKRHQDQRRKERERAKTFVLAERDNCHAEGVTDRGPRRRPETESKKYNSGPDRTGTGPSDFVDSSYGFELPDWQELAPWASQQVEKQPAGRLESEGVWRVLTNAFIQNPQAISEWHAQQLSLRRPVAAGTLAHQVLCLAAGLYVGGLIDSQVRTRVGLFSSIVRNGGWDVCRGKIPQAIKSLGDRLQTKEVA